MRIAYIAPYQGANLVKNRPIIFNASLAAKVKIGMIAELLRRNSHDIEIISEGETDRNQYKFYASLRETELFHPDIPIFYASALPIRFINGFWSSWHTLQLFRERHRVRPFDLVIIYNMKRGHMACANYAMRRLGLPVILEYEDDLFVDVQGKAVGGFLSKHHLNRYATMLQRVSGCMAVSPYLLTQLPAAIPKLLLRGVVSDEIVKFNNCTNDGRKNRVVFSGTHEGTQGLEQMVKAWQMLQLPDWELHIAGRGPLTATLKKQAEDNYSIVFHGFLNREENARLYCTAKIGMNPQDVTKTPGNVFALKIIEYLAAGLHVVTTPRGALEAELETGVSYIADNNPDTIAAGLRKIIRDRAFEHTAVQAAMQTYGPETIMRALNRLVEQVTARSHLQITGMNANCEPAARNP
jgi:glycosyltransferase involved in cell wall biosynthesis